MAKRGAKKFMVPTHELYRKHCSHANKHLCDLVAKRQMAKVAGLSKGAKYVCYICGRAAARASSLCEPVAV